MAGGGWDWFYSKTNGFARIRARRAVAGPNKITPLHRDPKQQELRVLFKASFDQGPYGGFFYRKCKYNIGFIDLATENVNIALVL